MTLNRYLVGSFFFYVLFAAPAHLSAQSTRIGIRAGVTEWHDVELQQDDYREFYSRSRFAPTMDIFLRRTGKSGWGFQGGVTATSYEHHARYHIWDAPDDAHSQFVLVDASATMLRDISLHLLERIHPSVPTIRTYAALSVHPGIVLTKTRWVGWSGWGGGYQDGIVRSWDMSVSAGLAVEHSVDISPKLSAESWLGYRIVSSGLGAFPTRYPRHRTAWLLGLSYRL